VRVGFDETAVSQCLRFNEMLGVIQGAVGRNITYGEISSGEINISDLTLATNVMVVHLENMLTPADSNADIKVDMGRSIVCAAPC